MTKATQGNLFDVLPEKAREYRTLFDEPPPQTTPEATTLPGAPQNAPVPIPTPPPPGAPPTASWADALMGFVGAWGRR